MPNTTQKLLVIIMDVSSTERLTAQAVTSSSYPNAHVFARHIADNLDQIVELDTDRAIDGSLIQEFHPTLRPANKKEEGNEVNP